MEFIVDNRARPLFAILFGYGLVMIYRKQCERMGAEEANRIIKGYRQENADLQR
ncbi:hypothetical protein ACT7DO_00125 [Bacillus pacificus]